MRLSKVITNRCGGMVRPIDSMGSSVSSSSTDASQRSGG